MFDLNQAIADWRRQMAAREIKSREVLDELEGHLRDDIEQQMGAGADAQKAFDSAVLRLGSARALQREFAKAYGPRESRRRRLVRGSCFISAIFVLLVNTGNVLGLDLSAWERVIGLSMVILTAAFLAVLPFLNRLLSSATYTRLRTGVKILSLLAPLGPLLMILTACHLIQFEFGILPTLTIWLFYAAMIMFVFSYLSENDGHEGGSTGSAPTGPCGPLPIFHPRSGPPDFRISVPAQNQYAPTARQFLEIAREEARRLGHGFIGTEHVLLGVLKLANGAVAAVLQRSNVDREAVRLEIERLVVAQPPQAFAALLPLTPRAQKALQLAGKEAQIHKQSQVHLEHILLGLLLEGSGVAALALKNIGIRTRRIREEISKGHARS